MLISTIEISDGWKSSLVAALPPPTIVSSSSLSDTQGFPLMMITTSSTSSVTATLATGSEMSSGAFLPCSSESASPFESRCNVLGILRALTSSSNTMQVNLYNVSQLVPFGTYHFQYKLSSQSSLVPLDVSFRTIDAISSAEAVAGVSAGVILIDPLLSFDDGALLNLTLGQTLIVTLRASVQPTSGTIRVPHGVVTSAPRSSVVNTTCATNGKLQSLLLAS
jgi:hypothetical protein